MTDQSSEPSVANITDHICILNYRELQTNDFGLHHEYVMPKKLSSWRLNSFGLFPLSSYGATKTKVDSSDNHTSPGIRASQIAFHGGLPPLMKFRMNNNINSSVLSHDDPIVTLNELHFEIDESKISSRGHGFVNAQDMDKYEPKPEGVSPEVVE